MRRPADVQRTARPGPALLAPPAAAPRIRRTVTQCGTRVAPAPLRMSAERTPLTHNATWTVSRADRDFPTGKRRTSHSPRKSAARSQDECGPRTAVAAGRAPAANR